MTNFAGFDRSLSKVREIIIEYGKEGADARTGIDNEKSYTKGFNLLHGLPDWLDEKGEINLACSQQKKMLNTQRMSEKKLFKLLHQEDLRDISKVIFDVKASSKITLEFEIDREAQAVAAQQGTKIEKKCISIDLCCSDELERWKQSVAEKLSRTEDPTRWRRLWRM